MAIARRAAPDVRVRARRRRPPRAIASALALAMATPASGQYAPAPVTAPLPASPASGIPSFDLGRPQDRPVERRRSWLVTPELIAEETYTDNVRLAAGDRKRSDWVTSLRPRVTADYLGPRARLAATYAPQLIYRVNEESNDLYHYLNANGNAELAERLLYVDATASVTQQNVTLAGPQAQSNINVTGNRTSVRSYSLSPYLRREFGAEALAELRYTHSTVSYSTNRAFTSDADRIDARVVSGPAYKLLRWNAAYHREHIRYTETGQTLDLESASVGGRRLITPNFGILGNVGYEDNSYPSAMGAPRGVFWSIGPEWTPTPRTRLAATVGHRYYGDTKSLDFDHRTRLTTWRLEYREDITTSRGQSVLPVTGDTTAIVDSLFRSTIPDAAARQTAVQNYIVQNALPPTLTVPLNYVTIVPFLQKRLFGSVAVQGVRNTIIADAFRQTREATAPSASAGPDLSLSPRTEQTGAGVSWTLRFSPRTSTTASAGFTRSEFPNQARKDDLTTLRVALNHQLDPRMSAVVSYRRLNNDSNRPVGSYRENAVAVLLSIRF